MPSTTLMMQSSARNPWHKIAWEPILKPTSNYYFATTQDGPTIVKYLRGLEIQNNIYVSTNIRNKGIVLFVFGDVIINGTLSMTSRGAYATGQNLAIDHKNARFLSSPSDYNSNPHYTYKISAYGGAGGSGSCSDYAGTFNGKVNSISSGGGGGSITYMAPSGAGSAGTSYSGGSGGGGSNYTNVAGYSGNGNGGPGGNARLASSANCGVGGGAGNPGGSGIYTSTSNTSLRYGYNGTSGTGGLLCLIVYGSIIIGSTGIISSNGSPGGSAAGGPGGGSGGGNITLLYTNNYINNGTIQSNGGLGGLNYFGRRAGSGGAGSIRIGKISI